jgi:hypothetical protein
VVIVLVIGPKVRGFNPAEDDGFLRAIKIRSTTSFGREVKPAIPFRKILRHVKDHYSTKEILVGQILGHFSSILSCFATRCLLVTATELWWINKE